MKLSNDFNRDQLRRYYDEIQKCSWCGEYKADSMHHVIPRATPHSSSILNATPLCNESCHLRIHGKICLRENQEKFIKQNIVHLVKQGYEFTDLDKRFIMYNSLDNVIKEI